MDDKLKPLPHLPHCRQFTIPLLYDSCPSVYQKLCALWAKLNELIDNYNSLLDTLDSKFDTISNDITNIKNELANITNLINDITTKVDNLTDAVHNYSQRLTEVEADVSNLTSSINNLGVRINQIDSEIRNLKNRISAIENKLDNLNIDIPVELLDDSTWASLKATWHRWFSTYQCDTVAPENGWVTTDKLFFWDDNTPPHSLKIGRVGQNIVLCKMPFILMKKGVASGSVAPQACKDLVDAVANNYSLMYTNAFTAGDGFFDWNSAITFRYNLDECKFHTAYIPFLPAGSLLYQLTARKSTSFARAIETDVRIQLNQNTKLHKMCVSGNVLYAGICPDAVPITAATTWSVYIYQIAENS